MPEFGHHHLIPMTPRAHLQEIQIHCPEERHDAIPDSVDFNLWHDSWPLLFVRHEFRLRHQRPGVGVADTDS